MPGLYKVGPETLRETSGLPKKAFQKAFKELHDSMLLRSDKDSQLVWLPSALYLMGPPANPNMVKGYCRSMQHMPKCALLDDALLAYAYFLTNIGTNFLEPFQDAFGDHLRTVFPNWHASLSNGFKTISGTYSNSDSHKYNDNHIDALPEHSPDPFEPRMEKDFAEIARDYDWPCLTKQTADRLLRDIPDLGQHEVRQAKLALAGRKDLRDPWSYFFAVIRRNRNDAGTPMTKETTRNEEPDPFKAYVDGEEVSLHG